MARKVTKFKSLNLLGENRKEEKRRLTKEITRRIAKGSTRNQINKLPSTVGATSAQISNRRKLLKEVKDFKPLTARQRLKIIG